LIEEKILFTVTQESIGPYLGVDTVLAKDNVSKQPGDWQAPFKALYDASRKRYSHKSSVWPKHLGEKVDIIRYLDSLNL
jgi:hypothetical protein